MPDDDGLPLRVDGKPVLRYAETFAARCPTCEYTVAVEQSDPYTGVNLRCVECGDSLVRLGDDATVPWKDVDPEYYKNE